MSGVIVKEHPDPHTLFLRDKGGFAWLIARFDEHTGMVAIHGDYGDAIASWTSIGNQSLREFFAGANNGYLIRKFRQSQPDLHEKQIDFQASLSSMMEVFDDAKPDASESDRDGFSDRIESWLYEMDFDPGAWPSNEIVSVLGSEFYEYIHRYSTRANLWRSWVLPTIRAELLRRKDAFSGWENWK